MGDRFDHLAKATAIAGLFLYLIGFAVVAFHDASYGFVAFNAFRAKIIGVGLIFAVFFFPAILAGARAFGQLGFTVQSNFKVEISSRAFMLHMYRMSDVFLSACVLFFFYQFLLADSGFRWSRFVLYLAYIAVKTLPGVWNETRFLRSPALFLLTAIATDLAGIAFVLYLHWFPFAIFITWFFVAGMEAYDIGVILGGKIDLRRHEWHFYVLSLFLLFSIFGTGIYPQLQPRVGGGHLTPISFQFSSTAAINKSLESDDLLVDEADDGFYVVRSKNDNSAIFIPRSIVSLVFFGSGHSPFETVPSKDLK